MFGAWSGALFDGEAVVIDEVGVSFEPTGDGLRGFIEGGVIAEFVDEVGDA